MMLQINENRLIGLSNSCIIFKFLLYTAQSAGGFELLWHKMSPAPDTPLK